MSIDATSTKANVIQNKLKRRASSSSELTSVSDSADRPGNKRAKNGDHSGKPTERAKVDTPGEHKEKGVYCHQCHRKCLDDGADTSLSRGPADRTDYLRCTRLKTFKKDAPKRACNITYCARDLKIRYDIEAATVKANGMDNDAEGHEGSYLFTCPCCTEECQCAICRKKKGLEPLGQTTTKLNLPTPPKSASSSTAKPSPSKLKQTTISDLTPKHKTTISTITVMQKDSAAKGSGENDSSTFPVDSDSDLSDAPPVKTAKPKARKSTGTASAAVKKGTPGGAKGADKTPTKKQSAALEAVAGKAKKAKKEKKDNVQTKKDELGKNASGKTKQTTNASTKTPTKPKATPKKAALKPVDPPVFEKVDTRLSQIEGEERMGLREFLVRFKSVLSIPERNLPPLDDFDRPLTEASVRLFAGALLDTIKTQIEENADDEDEELLDNIFNYREELRYYADLVRFAAIFNALKGPLRFRVLKAPPPPRDVNEAQVRALLDLNPEEPTPAWALEAGPSRRAASKVPQPAEVVRMLLALVDRAAQTPTIRAEMESTAGESEARRLHASSTKRANVEWEAQKKKLGAERVTCKTATDTKNNKAKFNAAQKEHDLQVAHANVNLRASVHIVRHEPLGRDLDGRVYYLVTPRPVEADSRPPVGWASGLLVYGAVPAKAEEDDLPLTVARWTHFGESAAIKQLVKWLEWRLDSLTPKSTPKSAAKPRKSTLEVVIPRKRELKKDAESDSDSDLSSVPDEDLLELLDPAGYEASREKVLEDGRELVRRVKEVVEWLEVVEWKFT